MEKTWKRHGKDMETTYQLFFPSNCSASGGFQIQNLDEKGYVYVQFESLKRGYIDDVEFLVTLGTDFRKTLWDSADLAAAVGFLIV
jgi:hypothetical protein